LYIGCDIFGDHVKKIRVGIAGVGRLGQLHTRLYREVAPADLIGVFDTDHERALACAKEFGVRAFESIDELFAAVEAVNIVTPTSTHFSIAKQATALGRHLFIEKPITVTTAEADELIRTCEQKHLVLQVGHIERFNPAVRALRGVEVSPMFIESHRLASFDPRGTDVAVVLDLMIHDLDFILSLVKSPLEHIDASGVSVISHEPDIANARLKFKNGCVANITASRISQKKMRKMRLFQRDAYISIDFLQGISEVFKLVAADAPMDPSSLPLVLGKIDQGEMKRHIIYEKLQAPEGNALKMELESFLEAIANGTPPPVTGEDGRRALEVATTITEMIKKTAPVV
jgi:predicted dehydrogenase